MKKLVAVIVHFGFWICLLFTYYIAIDFWIWVQYGTLESDPISNLVTNTSPDFIKDYKLHVLIGFLVLCVPLFYLSYFIFKPKLIDKKRFLILFIFFATIIGVIAIAYLYNYHGNRIYPPVGLVILFTFLIISLLAGIVFRYLADYTVLKRQKDLLEKHKLNTELTLLKSQINPHFLFNTLNNIDVLISKDSEKASIYIKQLSDILRFMLYETKNELIPLNLELEYIEKYIELQKIRTSNDSFVNFKIHGETDELFIAPMIFIPFIENAFKHTSNKKSIDAIKIRFDFLSDSISFNCENFKNKSDSLIQKRSGLGINLIEQRLNLLYKGKHTLKIENSEEKYSVALTIRLDED